MDIKEIGYEDDIILMYRLGCLCGSLSEVSDESLISIQYNKAHAERMLWIHTMVTSMNHHKNTDILYRMMKMSMVKNK
jgi:hypothetical protein